MRSVHFADTYLPRRDGVATSLRTLTGALADTGVATLTVVPRHRRELAAAVADDLRQVRRLRSVPSGVAGLRLAPWPRAARHVAGVAGWRPDIVHVHTPGPVGLLGMMTARRLGCPLVQTYHTDLHAYADAYRIPPRLLRTVLRFYAWRLGVPPPPVRDGDDERHAVLDAMNELLLGYCDAVVVPTRAVLRRGRLPVPDERVTVVPAGVTPPVAAPGGAAALRGHLGIGGGEQVVLFVGRVHREKGVDLLLRAFAHLVARRPMTRLVLLGAVYDERWLRDLLAETGAGDRTVLTGEQPPAVVAAAYAAADVFAFPSLTDTQGLVLQEAALAGLPVVMADPDLRAAGPIGDAAVLADADPASFATALHDILSDPVRAAELGGGARARAESHTPQRYAATMLDLYREVLATRGSPHRPHRPVRRTPPRRVTTKVRLPGGATRGR